MEWYHFVMRVERLRSVVEVVRSRRESFLKPFSYARRLHDEFVEKLGLGSALLLEGCLLGPPVTLGLGLLTGNPLAIFLGMTATLAGGAAAILAEINTPGSIKAAVLDLRSFTRSC